jgi:phosphoribosyl 1,2-cyclic phosphate phosphodiesterase
MSFTVLGAYETVSFGAYRVTALPARHMAELTGAFIYVIEREGKCILYAHDTGMPFEEVFDFIRARGFCFDLVSMDCTCGDMPTADEAKHMGIENNRRMLARLSAYGAITAKTVCVINHFSHNCDPLQHRLEALVAPLGWQVAYDGFEAEF